MSNSQSIRAELGKGYPEGCTGMPVADLEKARQINNLNLQMSRVLKISLASHGLWRCCSNCAECILQTSQLANTSQSGAARMTPQSVPAGETITPIQATGSDTSFCTLFRQANLSPPQAQVLLYCKAPSPPRPTARVCKMQYICQEICSCASRTPVYRSSIPCGNHSHDCNPFNW